jgi:hypothetical protein
MARAEIGTVEILWNKNAVWGRLNSVPLITIGQLGCRNGLTAGVSNQWSVLGAKFH